MSEMPVWDGELLELIEARRALVIASLGVARDEVNHANHGDVDKAYGELANAARRLTVATDAYSEKLNAMKTWLALA